MIYRTICDVISEWQAVGVQSVLSIGQEICSRALDCPRYVIVIATIVCPVMCDIRLWKVYRLCKMRWPVFVVTGWVDRHKWC